LDFVIQVEVFIGSIFICMRSSSYIFLLIKVSVYGGNFEFQPNVEEFLLNIKKTTYRKIRGYAFSFSVCLCIQVTLRLN